MGPSLECCPEDRPDRKDADEHRYANGGLRVIEQRVVLIPFPPSLPHASMRTRTIRTWQLGSLCNDPVTHITDLAI